jgi:hypothetical protein
MLTQRLIVMAAVLAVCAGAGSRAATAQAKLNAQYTAYLAGLPVGKGSWVIDIDNAHYSATVSGATTGLVRVFTGGQGTTAAQGSFNGSQPAASTYTATMTTTHKSDSVQMTVTNGVAKDIQLDPPIDADPERVPVTDALRQSIVDPMTASLVRMPGTGDLLTSEACQRSASVFDGRLRYDLRLAFKRMEKVKADKGYAGVAVVCAVYFTPIAGHIPSRAAVKYLTNMRDMEVWLVPIAGTRVLVPFRFQVPTPIGLAAVEADQFVSVPRTVTKGVKTQ